MNNEKKEQKNSWLKSLMFAIKLFFKRVVRENDFLNNKIIFWLLALNLFFNIANWVILLIFANRFDTGIILHYNVYFGVDSMGDWKNSLIAPAVGMILFLLNAVLAAYFYGKKERIASHILLLASLMAQLSLIIGSISVIMINY